MGTDDGKTSLTNEKITYHCHSESNSVAFISGKLAAIVRKHYLVDELISNFMAVITEVSTEGVL